MAKSKDSIGHYYCVPNRIELWVAMDLLFGSITDESGYAAADQFLDFCSWLVARGRSVFEKAVADPDSLAELPLEERAVLTSFWLLGNDAWVEKTGDYHENYPNLELPAENSAWAEEVPIDWDIQDEEELKRRFPRLTAGRL